MDGLLVVDKPSGPTSHDIVARLRRLLKERSIGHTGTLDPMASGVLPLVVGRATRLARFMSASEKRYDAAVRLGFATDTCDALGQPVGARYTGPMPTVDTIDQALEGFRGTFLQQPPAFSAKKVDGKRSYRLARARSGGQAEAPEAAPALAAPVLVTAMSIDLIAIEGDSVLVRIACASGFYVRALAFDLGRALGTEGHLSALRRTATSGVSLADAVTLAALEREGGLALAQHAMVPIERMLPHFPGVALTEVGADRTLKGRDLGPEHAASGFPSAAGPDAIGGVGPFRLFDPAGHLLGIAEPSATPGLLHPAVVLM